MVEQFVLAQPLAMIGGDDQESSLEHAAALQFIEQHTQLLVEIGEATIVAIADERLVARRQPRLVVERRPLFDQEGKVGLALGLLSKSVLGAGGDDIRRVSIEIIEED